VPTERVSTPASNSSIADLMIVVISSALVAIRYSRVVALRLFMVRGFMVSAPRTRGGCEVVRDGHGRCRR
jgi:hypothetical protein